MTSNIDKAQARELAAALGTSNVNFIRITGHALIGEGRPHDDNGHGISTWRLGTGGIGRAKCQCGALSDVLDSSPKRKRWHRQHKIEVATDGVR